MEGEGGVPVAGHCVVRLLGDGGESGVGQLATVNEGGVEEFELLLADRSAPGPVDRVEQSLPEQTHVDKMIKRGAFNEFMQVEYPT